MNYKLNDSGLIPEYINYKLGIYGNKITEQTITRLKQYQCSFQRYFIDNTLILSYVKANGSIVYNPLPEDYSIYDNYFSPENADNNLVLPSIYPVSFVDISTLPALCDIEIKDDDIKKISQAQSVLSGTTFNNTNLIEVTGLYDDQTINAIRNFQIQYNIGQNLVQSVGTKNIFPNYTRFWFSGKATGYEKSSQNVILDVDSTCISSSLIQIDNNYNYVFDNFKGMLYNEYIVSFLFFDYNKDLMDLSLNSDYNIFDGNYFAKGRLPVIPVSQTQIKYIIAIVKKYDNSNIVVDDILDCTIQIEKANNITTFEPNTINNNYLYFSGRLNIPTYNKLKAVYGLDEVLDI